MKNGTNVIPIKPIAVAAPNGALPAPCGTCHSRSYSLCACLSPDRLEELAHSVAKVRMSAHQTLFERGQPADTVYTVTSGALKLYSLMPDGRRQIIGFPYPGDQLNFGALAQYPFNCEALTETTLCRFSRAEYTEFLDRFPELRQALTERTLDELRLSQHQLAVLGRQTATERLASFLLQLLSKRSQVSANVVQLPMTRTDIADYLGLTTETVSRSFSQFRRDGLISLNVAERVGLLDIPALTTLAGG